MPGVKLRVDTPSDGNSVRTPMVDGDPGQVIGSRISYDLILQQLYNLLY